MKNKSLSVITLLGISCLILLSCNQKVESGFADINGTSIYYEIKGEGIPIILMHGFACDTRNWDNQFELLSKDYKVIRFDFRGFGKSQVPDTIKAYSHTKDLIALMDYLKIEKAVIVGHSLGGKAAFQITFENPERVLALILPEGGPWHKEIWEEPLAHDFINMFAEVNKIAKEKGIEKGKEAYLGMKIHDAALRNSFSKEMTKMMVMDYSGWHWQNKNPEINAKPISMHDFSRIDVPTLLMQGELSIDFYSYVMGVLQEYIPNSKLVIISNSSHMLNLENPEQFNYEVITFLKENSIK